MKCVTVGSDPDERGTVGPVLRPMAAISNKCAIGGQRLHNGLLVVPLHWTNVRLVGTLAGGEAHAQNEHGENQETLHGQEQNS